MAVGLGAFAGGIDNVAVIRQRLTRRRLLKFFPNLPPCLIGMEAGATSHYWARELVALGHDVKLMPAQYVKLYVKRGKNDAADAGAICGAVTRPTMRLVGVKSPGQQSAMMLHRVRLILNRQRTQLSNAMRVALGRIRHCGVDRQERHRAAPQRDSRSVRRAGASRRAVLPENTGMPAARQRHRGNRA